MEDRFVNCILGLAVGESIGMTVGGVTIEPS